MVDDTEIRELLHRARTAPDLGQRRRAENEVVERHLGLARSLAARYANRGQDIEDLRQVAQLGLVKAVRRFDPERGDFVGYAVPTILGELKRYFRDEGWTIRPPRRIQEMLPDIVEATARHQQQDAHEPTTAEIAADLGVPESEVREALTARSGFAPVSLDERDSDPVDSAHEAYEMVESLATLSPACRDLSPRDRKLLWLRFFCEMSQQQIADELGVSQMQVSRLLRRLLDDLRTAVSVPNAPKAA